MGSYHFTYKTKVAAPIDEVWAFFSTATNLAKITTFPKVKILSNPETEEGNEISMNLSFGLASFNWISSIDKVEKPNLFIDTGVKLPLPFTSWTHEHRFSENGNETVMTDSIVCRALVPNFIVKIILTNMFQGRDKQISSFFGQPNK